MQKLMNWNPERAEDVADFIRRTKPIHDLTINLDQEYAAHGPGGQNRVTNRKQFINRLEEVHNSERAGDYMLQADVRHAGGGPVELTCILRPAGPEERTGADGANHTAHIHIRSSLGKGGSQAGYAAYVQTGDGDVTRISGAIADADKEEAGLKALLKALKFLRDKRGVVTDTIELHSDSELLELGFDYGQLVRWEHNGFRDASGEKIPRRLGMYWDSVHSALYDELHDTSPEIRFAGDGENRASARDAEVQAERGIPPTGPQRRPGTPGPLTPGPWTAGLIRNHEEICGALRKEFGDQFTAAREEQGGITRITTPVKYRDGAPVMVFVSPDREGTGYVATDLAEAYRFDGAIGPGENRTPFGKMCERFEVEAEGDSLYAHAGSLGEVPGAVRRMIGACVAITGE